MKALVAGAALVSGIAMAGCDGASVDKSNATPQEVAAAVEKERAAIGFTPGRWESTVTMVAMDAPDMPAEAKAAIMRASGQPRTFATCLTREAAARPATDFFTRDAKDCIYDRFTLGGGKIDAAMKCGAGVGAINIAMAGDYDATHYRMKMATTVSMGGTSPVGMTMDMAAAHKGACRGDEDNDPKTM